VKRSLALTAYDYPSAKLLDEAECRYSCSWAIRSRWSSLVTTARCPLTVDEMLHHVKAVRRGTHRALVVADMPYGSYHASIEDSIRTALRFVIKRAARRR
jgi:3-methyl-2-oxobutanoate hydroxymethyltransferase